MYINIYIYIYTYTYTLHSRRGPSSSLGCACPGISFEQNMALNLISLANNIHP